MDVKTAIVFVGLAIVAFSAGHVQRDDAAGPHQEAAPLCSVLLSCNVDRLGRCLPPNPKQGTQRATAQRVRAIFHAVPALDVGDRAAIRLRRSGFWIGGTLSAAGFAESLYNKGIRLFTVGSQDPMGSPPVSRLLVVADAATGLGFVTLVIS